MPKVRKVEGGRGFWANRAILTALAIMQLSSGPAKGQTALTIQIQHETTVSTHGPGSTMATYFTRIILHDGSHAKTICNTFDEGCFEIEPFAPEHMKPEESKKCTFKAYGDGLSQITCEINNLGSYEATREANNLLIKTPKGIVRCHIDGSW